MKGKKRTIGRRERVDFPDLDLFGIEAKVDTGAYTTALHCHDIRVEKQNGGDLLCYRLLDPDHPIYNNKEFTTSEFWRKKVRNSFGQMEERYIIKTRIRIGPYLVKAFLSLTDRGSMRYPVLLGRRLLKRRFIVDVENEYTLSLSRKHP